MKTVLARHLQIGHHILISEGQAFDGTIVSRNWRNGKDGKEIHIIAGPDGTKAAIEITLDTGLTFLAYPSMKFSIAEH